MGFMDAEDIEAMIIEQVEDEEMQDEISEKWIREMIKQKFSELRASSKSWPKPTDTERLAVAFNNLCKRKIVALHNAGYTTSDGEDEVIEVERELRSHGIVSDGYCFYHEQDLERAIDPDDRSLWIAYQKVNNEDENVTLEVGRIVAEELRKQGFTVNWNDDVNEKIEVQNIRWQKLYDEDDFRYDHSNVIEIMVEPDGTTE
jgi:ethanolamine utilization protein EutQ (cupin superfamily)